MDEQIAALKIQKAWRSFTNRRIYKYYRDIIYFKCKGNPARLLKGINPNEAYLLEPGSNAYVRFRLGGESFPPNIYYKIFVTGKVVDLNAFAPRDYSSLPRQQFPPKLSMDEYLQKKNSYEQQGWYLRVDNNGWRPISHKMFVKVDEVESKSTHKVRYYHHRKEKRQEKFQKKRRINKLKWLQHMFEKVREQERAVLQPEEKEFMTVPEDFNPLKDPRLVDLKNEDFDEEVKELIEWSQNLDYDSYLKDWFQMSISRPAGLPALSKREDEDERSTPV